MILLPPSSTLFPYPTLFRSPRRRRVPGALPGRRRRRPLLHARRAARGAGRARDAPEPRVAGAGAAGGRAGAQAAPLLLGGGGGDRKSTRLNSSHGYISYAVF